MDSASLQALTSRALVPEHSAGFMQALSGGTALWEKGFLFLHAEDWLMGIGYPLAASLEVPELAVTAENTALFGEAMEACIARTGAAHCWAIAPELPERFQNVLSEKDVYYLLPATAAVPASLRGPTAKAAEALTVTEDRDFTAAHRRLWAEFLARVSMKPNVRELYARTEAALALSRACCRNAADARAATESNSPGLFLDLRLLNAWDAEGNLAASLVLDYSPEPFCSYIVGAHSRRHYTPHATDLLFARLLENARNENKRFIHLGLGVNEGITRFKKKWGGQVFLPYVKASWQVSSRGGVSAASSESSEMALAVRSLFNSSSSGLSKQQIFDSFPQQRPFGMIYSVVKGDSRSWLCGSAHFFRYSFEFAFRDLFEPLHTVIFEGPLDDDFLLAVEDSGMNPKPGSTRLVDVLDERAITRLERMINGPRGALPRLLGLEKTAVLDVRALLTNARPWFAFFSLWVAYLEGRGWHESVDLEAWRTARDMGKAVIAMENLEEQLASLESVPVARIVDFFRQCDQWPAYIKRNVRTYLDGDLYNMMGSSIEFPTRTEQVIDKRDQRFRERMRPFLEAGGCAVFVGAAHLLGLIPMLRQDGFTVSPHYPSLRLKLKAALRKKMGTAE